MFDPKFWVGVAFVIFVALVFRTAKRFLTNGLDARGARIKDELEQAVKLREEAQAILASYQHKQEEALREAGQIVEQARIDAKRMIEQAHDDLEVALKQRVENAMKKIAQYEASVMQDVKNTAVDLAINAARQFITNELSKDKEQEIIDHTIDEITKKFALN